MTKSVEIGIRHVWRRRWSAPLLTRWWWSLLSVIIHLVVRSAMMLWRSTMVHLVMVWVGLTSVFLLVLEAVSAGEHDRDILDSVGIALANNTKVDCISLLPFFHSGKQVLRLGDGFSVNVSNNVTHDDGSIVVLSKGFKARKHGRAVVENFTNQATLKRNSELLFNVACDSIIDNRHSQSRSDNLAVDNELVDDTTDGIHWNGESNSNISGCAIRREDRSVDSNQASVTVQKGASTVAWIDGSIGLNTSMNRATACSVDVSTKSRDDTSCECIIKAERVANGDDTLTDLKVAGNTNWNGRWQISWIEISQFQDCQV
mmetsp:Transcript_43841/g.105779  ORF Transcript_43841/g.105779 Transcript_43841/m.105779 type:complete len:316 (-) Transcript_43841:614-1561(-)